MYINNRIRVRTTQDEPIESLLAKVSINIDLFCSSKMAELSRLKRDARMTRKLNIFSSTTCLFHLLEPASEPSIPRPYPLTGAVTGRKHWRAIAWHFYILEKQHLSDPLSLLSKVFAYFQINSSLSNFVGILKR